MKHKIAQHYGYEVTSVLITIITVTMAVWMTYRAKRNSSSAKLSSCHMPWNAASTNTAAV